MAWYGEAHMIPSNAPILRLSEAESLRAAGAIALVLLRLLPYKATWGLEY